MKASEFLSFRGMRSEFSLASDKSHGERMVYRAGCRCTLCRQANTAYETARAKARKGGDWNGIVPAEPARAHMLALRAQGVGRRQIADASGVGESIVQAIGAGRRLNARALTVRSICAVTKEALADRALIDAGPSWKLLDELLATGYTKAFLSRQLGYKHHSLQLGRERCTNRNAFDVARLYQRLRRVPAADTQRLIAELREEGYRLQRIHQMVIARAEAEKAPVPDLKVHRGFISAATARLVQQLHAELIGEA